jgi:hypothetical protein
LVDNHSIHPRKRLLVTAIAVSVGLLHFVTGPSYRGPYPEFVNGYLIDILLPLALYFLLCLVELSFLKSWFVKAILVFGVGFSVEVAQYFGVPLLGRTYDPLDFLMYALGVILAAALDKFVFPRTFKFWTLHESG